MTPGLISIVIALIITIGGLMLWPRLSRLNVFFALLFAAFTFALIAGLPLEQIVPTMQNGFGTLLGQIGMVVALGSVLGIILEKTGAMTVISEGILRFFGMRRPVLAVSVIGAMVGIPVFCDSGFIILSRLLPNLAMKSGTGEGSLVLALSSGLYTTHTLVPPTPGPLTAAATLGLSDHLGAVIGFGILGSIPVVMVSWLFSLKVGRKLATLHTLQPVSQSFNLPFWTAFLPLALPVLLIGASSLSRLGDGHNLLGTVTEIIGMPMVALLIGVLLALRLIPITDRASWPGWITEALKDAGVIILITGAGGAFGAVIKASDLARYLSAYVAGSAIQSVAFLALAWVLAAILKTAQGSSTSAMIVTSSILMPLAAAAGFGTVPELCMLVLAIGGGAMAVSHANDSYFWVVTQFGGITQKDAFRSFTLMTLLQGLTALLTAIAILFFL